MTKQEALENLELVLTSPRRRAPDTLRTYISTAKIFLNWMESDAAPTERDVRRFFIDREKAGIAASTRSIQFLRIKKLFEANNWAWPFKKEDRPVSEEIPNAPAFTQAEIEQLIAARDKYSAQENYYLAMSVTYGLRREEITRITSKDIKDNVVFIRTAKRGPQRQHLIPVEIMPILAAWKPQHRTAQALSYSFQSIMKKSGLGVRRGWGFHSIRRSLLTLLVTNLAANKQDPTLAAQFLRWSRRTIGLSFLGSAMAGVYAHPEILSTDPYGVDRIIFQYHPFLPAYRNG